MSASATFQRAKTCTRGGSGGTLLASVFKVLHSPLAECRADPISEQHALNLGQAKEQRPENILVMTLPAVPRDTQ